MDFRFRQRRHPGPSTSSAGFSLQTSTTNSPAPLNLNHQPLPTASLVTFHPGKITLPFPPFTSLRNSYKFHAAFLFCTQLNLCISIQFTNRGHIKLSSFLYFCTCFLPSLFNFCYEYSTNPLFFFPTFFETKTKSRTLNII